MTASRKIWLVSVNMGYGHQRTAFPLKKLAVGKEAINANDYSGIPSSDRKIWESARRFYEFISNFKRVPLIGEAVFFAYDRFQKIFSFYPKRDLSKPNFSVKQIYSLMRKGWGKDLVEKLKIKNEKLKIMPSFVTTFFTPAFMAEFFKYPGEIFCIICDADISRSWAALEPAKSKIKYLVPTERAGERLKLYGVAPKNIFFTGYPLPQENVGAKKAEISKNDLRYRLLNLDPQKKYFEKYRVLVEKKLGKLPPRPNHFLTLMFSVGGAGTQKEIGTEALKSLSLQVKQKKVKIILSAGIRQKVKDYFDDFARGRRGVEVLFGKNIEDYFQKFNTALRQTDILWTKPSELSFYSALGIPIIVAPPVGSQEDFNKRWLLKSGFGLSQENPKETEQWLFDWLNRGYLAEAAMQGFVEGEKLGALNIKKIIEKCSG